MSEHQFEIIELHPFFYDPGGRVLAIDAWFDRRRGSGSAGRLILSEHGSRCRVLNEVRACNPRYFPARVHKWRGRREVEVGKGLIRLVRAAAAVGLDRALARAAAAHLLDLHFQVSSPIPEASPELLAKLDGEVLLPPVSALLSGNQSRDGLCYLVALARDASVVFEIGTYNGVTAWTLARNLPEATVHTLDLPAGAEPTLELGPADEANIIDFPKRAYEATRQAERVVQHFGDSATFDFTPWEGQCGLVYVDGAHSLKYVRSDTENALRMVAPGGAIVWDDYWRRVPHVVEYLNALDLPLIRLPGTRLVASLNR